ncbi:MAG TPA: hypothetical protein VKV33_11130, partial [Streptosporangiaceae bacterium]|nr:hypothetical protein [Streptosporangiaceae bacterium]
MGRPADWGPLAGTDPVPGDPEAVAALGRRFRATAAEIDRAAARLRTMCTDEFWESDASAAFRGRSDDTAGKLAKAYARYHAAATALGTDSGDATPSTPASPRYAGALNQAQQVSAHALASAQDAATAQRQAMSQLHATLARARSGGSVPVTGSLDLSMGALTPGASGHLATRPGESADITALKTRYNNAADQLGAARALLARAERIRDTAARNASQLISDVIGRDGLTDGFLDYLTNLIDEHAGLLKAISAVAGWVATIAGTLALIVGWIPIVGQALAAVLGTIALAASVVLLISDSLLAIGGKGTWLDVGLDVIAVATFGLGRAAAGALEDSAVLARAAGRSEEFGSRVAGLMSSERWLKGGETALDQVLPDAWKVTNRAYSDLEEDSIRKAAGHAPGAWPKWGDVLRGFHPVTILRDGLRDVGKLKIANWVKLGDRAAWECARFFIGDPEIHEALAG